MSARKRRIKRKLEMLRKLDRTYWLLYRLSNPNRNTARSLRIWVNCVIALGDALQRKGIPAWQHLERSPKGTEILMRNYNKRKGDL